MPKRASHTTKVRTPAIATAQTVLSQLQSKAKADKAGFLPRFFKTGPGEYGEGDFFLGVVVPDQRAAASQFRDLATVEVRKLLSSKWHECRLTAVFILVLQFERSEEPRRAELVEFYLSNLDSVNNWDIVDSSAPKILGVYSIEVPEYRKRIEQLAASGHLWRERVAVLATLAQIKRGDFRQILKLAKSFLNHEHDLIHKAVGWMLREMGGKDLQPLLAFLDANSTRMPRTMLRYAIEKLPHEQRRSYLERTHS
jgi:3-methyladenine DNA glycosylase AlkD